MNGQWRVALFIEAHTAQGRGLLRGIAEERTTKPTMSVYVDIADPWRMLPAVAEGDCDGIIAHLSTAEHREQLTALGRPIVFIDDVTPTPERRIASVGLNERSIGRLAADHLAELRLRHFAMASREDAAYCTGRAAGFEAGLAAAGFAVDSMTSLPFAGGSIDEIHRLGAWLESLPTPIGIFACDDEAAFNTIEAARRVGRSVPDDVAVLGVSDDPTLVTLARPQLSSVRVAYEPIGSAAAQLLQRMLEGEPAPAERVRFDPVEVARRGSTDVLAVADPDLVAAVQFVRDHAHRPIQVVDILEAVPMSRRSLERRFREHLGRSPQQEIQRVRVDTARRLLAETTLAIHEVATKAGFSDPDRLASVFRKVVGETPSAYRERFRRR